MQKNRHKKYITFMKWLVKDVTRTNRIPMILSTVLGFVSQGFLVGSLLLTLQYANMINSGDKVQLFHWTFELRTSTVALFGIALSVMLIFATGSYCGYLSRKLGFNIRRKYTEYCTNRALSLISQKKLGSENPEDLSPLLKVVRAYPIYCGRVANQMVSSIPEILVFGFTLISLLILEPFMTVLLVVVSFIGFLFIYRSNIRGAADSSLCDTYKPRVNRCLASEIQGRIKGNRPNEPFTHPDWVKWMGYYIGRVSIVEVGGLVAGLVASVLFAVVLIGLVSDVMNDGSWNRVLIYLVLFRVNVAQFRLLIRRITSINRFYPQSYSYWNAITTGKLSHEGRITLEDLELDE